MTLVKLTAQLESKPVYVNPEKVEAITEVGIGSGVWTSCCVDVPFIVREKPHEVVMMISDDIR